MVQKVTCHVPFQMRLHESAITLIAVGYVREQFRTWICDKK